MLRISEEDYRSLELRLQTEVRKVFAQFREDHKRNTSLPDEKITARELQRSPHPAEPGTVKSLRTPARPEKRRSSKKATEMNRLREGTPHPDRKSSSKILEEDMVKIFRKKYRRRKA